LDDFGIFWQVIGQVSMHRVKVRLLLYYFEEFVDFQQSEFILTLLLSVWELFLDLALIRTNEPFLLVFEVSIQPFETAFFLQIEQNIIEKHFILFFLPLDFEMVDFLLEMAQDFLRNLAI
jgi:hypothetical protein